MYGMSFSEAIRAVILFSVAAGIFYFLLFSKRSKDAEMGSLLRKHGVKASESSHGSLWISGWKPSKSNQQQNTTPQQ